MSVPKARPLMAPACCDDAPFDVPMAVDVDKEEEGDEEDADDNDDDNDGHDKDSANLALERVTGPADTPSGGFSRGRPRFLPPEVDTPDDGTKEVKEDETADTNDDDGIEGRDGKDEGNDEQADANEEDNDTPVGSVPSEGAPPVSVAFFGGRPRLGLDARASIIIIVIIVTIRMSLMEGSMGLTHLTTKSRQKSQQKASHYC